MEPNHSKPGTSAPRSMRGRLIRLVYMSLHMMLHSVHAWLSVICARLLLRRRHELGWPIDLEIVSAGFKASLQCVERHGLDDFRPMLLALSWLQFYPSLDITRVDAGGCEAFWISLKEGRHKQDTHVVLYYVHGGAFVAGDALMTSRSFQHWMKRLAGQGIHAKVLSLQYPLAPEHPFPAAVLATAASYAWLTQQLAGSSTQIIPVGDSAGANILVAALASLRDHSNHQQQQQQPAAAAAAANKFVVTAGPARDAATQPSSAAAPERPAPLQPLHSTGHKGHQEHQAAAEAARTHLFANLSSKLSSLQSNTTTSNNSNSSSSISSSCSNSASSDCSIAEQGSCLAATRCGTGTSTPTSSACAAAGTATTLTGCEGPGVSPGGAAAVFVPPAAIVLVSPAMDTSSSACFHDEVWRATHEARFDYLPHNLVGGGMSHYVTHPGLLPTEYVSPINLTSFQGLVSGPWLVLSGGAELLAQDINRFVSCVTSSVGVRAVHHHQEPHMPHSWAILPTPSMWPRQQVVVDFIAAAATAAAATAAAAAAH